MKRYVVLTIACFLFSFIYLAFIQVLFGFFTPNFLVILPIALMYKNKQELAYFVAFVLGIFADLFVGQYLGITSLFLVLITGLFYHLKYRISFVNTVTAFTVFFSCIAYDLFVQQFLYSKTLSFLPIFTQAVISTAFVFITIRLLNLIPNEYFGDNKYANK